jgi:DNA-binding MarR family transcriptional regulator
MKDIINKLNKAFENRIRLGIMSVLSVNDKIDFNALKDLLKVTDGNLASHLNHLEKMKYIKVYKEFIGKKPNTSYTITAEGKKAFHDHLSALEQLIKNMD